MNESVFGRIATYRGELGTPHKDVGHLTEVAPGFLEVSCSTNKNSKLLLLSTSSSTTFPFSFLFFILFSCVFVELKTSDWFLVFFFFLVFFPLLLCLWADKLACGPPVLPVPPSRAYPISQDYY